MRKRGPFAIVIVLIIIAGMWLILGQDSPPEETAPVGTAGFVATVDGEFAAPVDTDQGAFSSSHEGLESRPSPTPGGGVALDLQGRFQNAATATVNDSGEVEIHCEPDSAHEGGEQ
jgi:hypothetical protein